MENHKDKPEQSHPQNTTSSDEIDLRELFRSIGDWFKNVGNALVSLIVTIRRYTIRFRILLILLLMIGAGLGASTGFLLDRFYSSSMVINSPYLNTELVENTVEKLDELCTDLNYPTLAKQLDIEEDVARQIRSFKYEKFVTEEEMLEFEIFKEKLKNQVKEESDLDEILPKIEVQNQKTYKILITTYDNNILPVLEEKLTEFFRNSPYLRKRIEIDRKNKESKIGKLKEEQVKLDSLKNVLYSNLQKLAVQKRDGSNNVILGEGQFVNPIEVFLEDISFYNQMLALERQLYIEEEFEVIEGFVRFNTPSSAGYAERTVVGAAAGLGLGYLIIMMISLNLYLERFEKRQMKQ